MTDNWVESAHFLTAKALRAERSASENEFSSQKELYLEVFDYVGDVFNGGFEQWFHNTANSKSIHVPAYLAELGLMGSSDVVRKALVLYFPDSKIPDDEGDRWEYISKLENSFPEKARAMESLTHRLWEVDEHVYVALVNYAGRHGFLVNYQRDET